VITLDASVWVAGLDEADDRCATSVRFLVELQVRGTPIVIPELALLEVGCAVARRRRDPAAGPAAVAALCGIPTLRILAAGRAISEPELGLGTRALLRATDAVYAATARLTGSILVSWDRELIERAGALTPERWLTQRA
jgi:predicted nucleic acid-binding protein